MTVYKFSMFKSLIFCFMPCFFGGPDPAPAAPRVSDAEVEAAKKKELELSRRRRGRGSTILTGPGGVAETSGKKTTLGG